jgi:DNA-binding PadR family transcriptional regulator
MLGDLKLYVLGELQRQPASGYALMSAAQRAGLPKPSPGTMYPLLATLRRKGLITQRTQGRRKLYALSAKGRALLEHLTRERERFLSHHLDVLGALHTRAEIAQMRKALSVRHGAHADLDVIHALKAAVLAFINGPRYRAKRAALRELLASTARKVRAL